MLGALVILLGTHSSRKGSATHASSFPGGPSTISVFLRAGWAIGQVQQRYIFAGQGADQLVGRCAAGLPMEDNNFAALPPHFCRCDGNPVLSAAEWSAVVPGYDKYPHAFKAAIPLLVASVVYHAGWLREHLPAAHPVFQTRLFTGGFIERLSPHVVAGCNHNPESGLVATGVPPHLILAHRLHLLEEEARQQKKANEEESRKLREVILQQHSDLLRTLPDAVASSVLARCQVGGAVPVTAGDLERTLQEYTERILAAVARHSVQPEAAPAPAQPASQPEQRETVRWRSFVWKGRIHPVPEDFTWPVVPIKAMWDLWLFGKPGEGIAPYKSVNAKFDLQPSCKRQFYAAKRVLESIIAEAHSRGLSTDSIARADLAFDAVFPQFVERISTGKRAWESRRLGELRYGTLYEDILNREKRQRVEHS